MTTNHHLQPSDFRPPTSGLCRTGHPAPCSLLTLLLLSFCLPAFAGITNLVVTQRPNVGLVDFRYDLLHSNAGPLTITVKVSTNGGVTYDLPATSFTGDIGSVTTGINKTITWNMVADWPNNLSTNVFFRVQAYDVLTNMAIIPAGTFTMGDNLDGDTGAQPTHTMTLSAFYMDEYEVTKAQWDAVFTWATNNGYSFDNAGSGKATNHPVQAISWYDSVKWCNARSQKEGLTPAYYTDAGLTTVYKTGQVAPYVRWNSGYRLPTEAEWEYAARGGLNGKRFPWGDTITHSQANYYSATSDSYDVSATRGNHPTYATNGTPCTSPVASFAANGYGLYDMAGNVLEWCWDWYGSYSSGAQTDPRGPASGTDRLLRSGSWYYGARDCRTADRYYGYPASINRNSIGFRAVRPPGQ